MHVQDIFYFSGVHILATGNDHIFFPINNVDVLFIIDDGKITGVKPPIMKCLPGLFRHVPVPGGHCVPLYNDFADILIVFGHLPTLIVHHLQADTNEFPAGTGLEDKLFFPGKFLEVVLENGECQVGTGFGHAVGLDVVALECLYDPAHDLRCDGRPTAQDHPQTG